MSKICTLTDLQQNDQKKIQLMVDELFSTRAELDKEIELNGKTFGLVKRLAERVKVLEQQLTQAQLTPLKIPEVIPSKTSERPDWDSLTSLLNDIKEKL